MDFRFFFNDTATTEIYTLSLQTLFRSLSVLLHTAAQPATPRQLGLYCEDDVFLPTVIISDGHLLTDNLLRSGHDHIWLQAQLAKKGVRSPSQVFLLTADERGETICIVKDAVK